MGKSSLHDTAISGTATVKIRELDFSQKRARREHVVLNLNVLAQAIGDGGRPDVVAFP
ncbi:MAG: hypothetical protein ACJAZD_003205 [Ilumatobacter sp.]